MSEISIKAARGAAAVLGQLPRPHRVGLAICSTVVLAATLWQPGSYVAQELNHRVEISVPASGWELLSEQNSEPLGAVVENNDPAFEIPTDELGQQLTQHAQRNHRHTVASGETLGGIFGQYGLPLADMYQMLEAEPALQQIGVGQRLEWTLDDNSAVESFTVHRSAKFTDHYQRTDNGYSYQRTEEAGELRPVRLSGRVSGSFYNSALAAGLNPNQIQEVVQALQWRFDFGRQARRGDRFAVTVEREYIDGKAVGRGEVKSLLYLNGNHEIFVSRHHDGQFYDVDGNSLDRALRRYPTAKRYRISSPFNPRRKHPVTGRISPHNGTDFATPIGTPVLSAGDGVVVKAQKHPLAGNYVVVKHGREYVTRYLHLHRMLVKPGERVTMGQRIALSGNTGRSTGPHLHYELIKKNRPVDAMKVPLPEAAPVPDGEIAEYGKIAREEKRVLQQTLNS
nr:murein DD-endopeptidase MepM [Photobacterium rosenbergii]